MVDETYFFDSYAVFEMLEGNPNYLAYKKSLTVLTKLNLFEIYYGMLREKGKEKAKELLEEFSESVVDYDNEDIIDASEIKKQNPRRSMADCIGYVVSLRLKIKFLTGDKEFEDYGKTNSNLQVGEIASQSAVFPSSPPEKSKGFLGPKNSSEGIFRKPEQTPHFSVEYKTEGFGDLDNVEFVK